MTRRILNAAFGLVAGILSLPLAVIAWPILAAWFMANDTEED